MELRIENYNGYCSDEKVIPVIYFYDSLNTNLDTQSLILEQFSINNKNSTIVFSFDVIHSLGFYCFGIKIDAIPARINLGSTLRSLFKGEHRGFCFELCGQGHSSMLIVGLCLS